MMIASENQLLSIDESCLSDLSEENESTISGGTFGLLSGLVGWLFGGLFGYAQPSTGTTVIVNNYITNTSSSSASSGSSSSSGGGAPSNGGYKP